MDLFTNDSDEIVAHQKMITQLRNRIEQILENYRPVMNGEIYLSGEDVCKLLHISEKTLWRMRTKGEITYSKMYGQYYYTIGAIKDMLNAHAVQTSEEYMQELIAKGKSYIEKGRIIKSGK